MSRELTRRTFVKAAAAAAVFMPYVTRASAQAWPTKPIRIVCAYPAGGQTDLFARVYGEFLARELGQPVVVDNKTGAGGITGALEVKSATPDGHTLLMTGTTAMIANRVLYESLPYDPAKDFSIISIMPSGNLPLVASSKVGAGNLREFIDYARTSNVNVGTWGAGSYAHVAIIEMNKQYGLKLEPVHYRGEAPMWTDLAAGAIDGGFGNYGGARGILEAGRGRGIAIMPRRSRKLENVATFVEQGAVSKGFELTMFQCLVAPAATPKAIVSRLSDLILLAGKGEKVRTMLDNAGIDEIALSADESQRLYDREAPVALDLVKRLGLTPV